MKKNKGFTLIELLVVIAIIGILSSVILASLNNARDKGKDASVKSQLSGMKAQAELFYSKGETYLSLCSTGKESSGLGKSGDPGLLQAVVGATINLTTLQTTLDSTGAYDKVTCHDKDDSWAVEAPIGDTSTSMFCVDSTGYSGVKTATVLVSDKTSCN